MLRRIPRFLRRAVLVAVVLAVSASVYQSWSAGSPGVGGWTQTEFGSIGPADRDLLVKVRMAGLWEGPTGQQAQQQATSPQVREIGRKISAEHATLDEEVRRVSNQLGVRLPSSPNPQQIAWMDEISARTGSDYDRTFIQRLREAHGAILPAIAEVRTSTRNDLLRQFAVTADEFVSRHCEYLESSGLVDYAALPQADSPGLLSGSTNPADLVVPILVFVAALLAAIGLFSALRNRRGSRPERVTVAHDAPVAAPVSAPLTAVAAIPGPRAGPTPYREVSDSGGYRNVTDSGRYRSATPTDVYRTDSNGYRRTGADTDVIYRDITDSGGYRSNGADTYPGVTDSGGYRRVSDSGSHRATTRTRPRHSIRR